MRLTLPFQKAARPRSRAGERAFTMIEIAIAVGVIGFALVAIIGILPRGMNVQKDNREDTIISQDAPYFLNAIRNGEQRTNDNILASYVESIAITNYSTMTTNPTVYTNSTLLGLPFTNYLATDSNIIGLLSTPEFDLTSRGITGVNQTNQVVAVVRAISGSAVGQTGANPPTAFRYQMTVEVAPWNWNYWSGSGAATSVYTNNASLDQMNYLASSLHEVRLKFAWPVLPNGNIGPGRQTYRTLVSGRLATNSYGSDVLWFFQPLSYSTATNL